MGICDKRTVIITGAGGGLGRAYALAFAEEGAQVVVNDIRGDAAEEVCALIRAMGGDAIADSNDITSIASAEKIVAEAEQHFGTVHVLLNNAGNLRDRFFVNLSEQEWDEIMRVHLKGHFCLANVLAKRWRDQYKAGVRLEPRIINTSSGAGLQGSVGQSNYSAAKAGIAALTLVQAAELGRYGITVNAIAPSARTAMTEQGMPDMVKKPEDGSFDFWDPANVAPLLVWLGSTGSAAVTGRVFEAGGGQVSIADGWRTGVVQDNQARWTPAQVGATVLSMLHDLAPPQKVYGT